MVSAPQDLRDLLGSVRTIAILGLSANPSRPSNEVAAFLVARGYRCFGVNPGLAGTRVHDIPVFGRLAEIGHSIDMVDVFRASHTLPGIVAEVLALDMLPRILWTQLGVVNDAAAAQARAAGVTVVMNNCPKIVLGQLFTRT